MSAVIFSLVQAPADLLSGAQSKAWSASPLLEDPFMSYVDRCQKPVSPCAGGTGRDGETWDRGEREQEVLTGHGSTIFSYH